MTDDIEESLALHKRGGKNPAFVYLVAVLSALGGLLYGYDTGVVSGAMILLRDTFKLDKFMQGVVVSVTIITAWVFCLLAGSLTDRYGRKIVIICASVVFILGSVLMGAANDVIVLIIGRVVVGMGIGLASMCVPMYIAEVSPPEIRGILVNINNCSTTFGQFLASLVSGAFSGDPKNGWRYMLGIAGVPAIFQFICFMFMPESPRWLIHKGKYEDAKKILQKLRGSNANIETEFDAIKSNCDEIKREHSSQNISVLRRIFHTSSVRKALFIGCSFLMFQQLAGINTVMYYSATIIEMSGVKSKSKAIWLSSATSAMNFVCSLIGLVFVERIGRRVLTLTSLSGVILSLTMLAISFQLADHYSPALSYKDPSSVGTVCNSFNNCGGCIENADCGYCFLEFANGTYDGTCLLTTADDGASKYGLCNTTELPHDITWAYSWCPSSYSWMTFTGLLLYLFFFTPGMGCMPPLVNSEIYPLWARGTCYSIATSVSWLSNFVISLTFLELMQALTKHGAFYFYDSLAISGLVFLFLMLPETKGVSLEEVENLFTRPWWKGATTSPEKKTTQYALRTGISNICADED